MSEFIAHECGIAMVRLLKPLEYYHDKYGTWRYGFNKLHLLMEKQHNRGQDGAGIASIKLDVPPGVPYINRQRSNEHEPIKDIFLQTQRRINEAIKQFPEAEHDSNIAKLHVPFAAEVYMAHLRYGTFGKNNIENVHPVMRQNNWKSKNLVLAGNFNLTNVDELFTILTELGQHPMDFSDTVTIMENVGHFLDDENQGLFDLYKRRDFSNVEISSLIEENLDLTNILRASCKKWDGGYVIVGMIGHGDAFVLRDPVGIRPAYYYHDDEVAVVASERPVIQTVMNVTFDQIKELQPGHAFIVKKNGKVSEELVKQPEEKRACSFERIYFSRGSDAQIYQERKTLGELLSTDILHAIDNDVKNTVFSYIPNTAETAFYGMVQGIDNYLLDVKKKKLADIENLKPKKIEKILAMKPRIEKIAIKDVKLRTFISADKGRDDLVAHVYDVTYGALREGKDNLVIIDDSIVRGTTLKQSILRILGRLKPKKIVIVSSSPQIRYPDCYGIDMAKLGDFIAFKAAIALLKEQGKEKLIEQVYNLCIEQKKLPKEEVINHVKTIYKPFTPKQISAKIAELLRPEDLESELEIVYQSIENLHLACPDHTGDWYFTGNYPTPGGNKVVNTSFINYIENRDQRAY